MKYTIAFYILDLTKIITIRVSIFFIRSFHILFILQCTISIAFNDKNENICRFTCIKIWKNSWKKIEGKR